LHHVAGLRGGTLAETHLGIEQVEHALFRDPPLPAGGRIMVPKAPGFGVELDRDALRDTIVT
ncbi:MAG: enolase C-terminal domain-like protein, partial [Pseudomonadota bacterium]